MRVPGPIWLAAAVAVLAPAAAAQDPAPETQTVSVTYRGGPGPGNWAYDFVETTTRGDGGRPRASARVEIRYPRGIRFNGRLFPACPVARQARCPASTKVGAGRAVFDARPDGPQAMPATVDVFNAAPRRGRPVLLYVFRPAGGGIPLTFAGVFVRDERQGPYGHVKVIDTSAFGPNPPMTPTRLELRMTAKRSPRRGRRAGRPLFEMTSPCSGGWSLEWRNVYSDGTALSGVARTPCPGQADR